MRNLIVDPTRPRVIHHRRAGERIDPGIVTSGPIEPAVAPAGQRHRRPRLIEGRAVVRKGSSHMQVCRFLPLVMLAGAPFAAHAQVPTTSITLKCAPGMTHTGTCYFAFVRSATKEVTHVTLKVGESGTAPDLGRHDLLCLSDKGAPRIPEDCDTVSSLGSD